MNTEVPENHTRDYTLGVIMKHTRKNARTSPDTTCHPLRSCFFLFFVFVLLSNVVCTDIHHLDDILMSHPQAVSISPPLSLFPLPPTRRPSLHK